MYETHYFDIGKNTKYLQGEMIQTILYRCTKCIRGIYDTETEDVLEQKIYRIYQFKFHKNQREIAYECVCV